MKSYTLFGKFIKESIDLGKVQFSPHRIDGVDTNEPNTPEEQKVYDVLTHRVRGTTEKNWNR